MVLKISFKQQRKQTNKNAFLGNGRSPFDSFDKFHKQKSYPFAVLPVRIQDFF